MAGVMVRAGWDLQKSSEEANLAASVDPADVRGDPTSLRSCLLPRFK